MGYTQLDSWGAWWMIQDLQSMADAIFTLLTDIFNLYTTEIVFTGALALWLLRKVVKVYRKL